MLPSDKHTFLGSHTKFSEAEAPVAHAHSFGKYSSLSPRKHVGSSGLLPRSSPCLRPTSYSLGPDHTRETGYFEYPISYIRPCTVVEGTEGVPMLHPNVARTVHVGDKKNHQEKVIFPNRESNFIRNESLLKHQKTYRAEGEVAIVVRKCASLDIRDRDVPAASIAENLSGYNQDWSPLDMIAFNGVLIDDKEVVCQWVDHGTSCNDPVKGKDLKPHLHLRHGITSDSQPWTCLWDGCSSRSMKKSSLERHIKEQHIPVSWACPTCEKTFTRKTSLMDHFERCLGRV